MIPYIQVIHEALDYIEDNLHTSIRVEDLSQHVYLSEFHFNRLFKTAVGLSPKQYILGRKMTLAQTLLANPTHSLIEIAYELGFEYPEVFSRAFKKQFGISPQAYRVRQPALSCLPRAEVVVRNWTNFQGTLVVRADFVELAPMQLEGCLSVVDLLQPGYEDKLRAAGELFGAASAGLNHLDSRRIFSVVNCQGGDDGKYDVFIGRERLFPGKSNRLKARQVPGGWYARFDYQGDIVDIRSTFVDDLFRWILVKDIRLASNGVGMLTLYDEAYFKTQAVKIYIPVLAESVPLQQKTS